MKDEEIPRQLAVGATVFYLVMGLVGLALIRLGDQDPVLAVFGHQETVLRDALLGSVAGLGVVGITWLLRRWEPLAQMKDMMAEAVGQPPTGVIVVLAITSAVGEELLFRGGIQPYLGLPLTAVGFGLMHGGLSPRFRTWVGFAILAGFLLGGLAAYTQNLLAPILCHLTVNYFNLHLIAGHTEK